MADPSHAGHALSLEWAFGLSRAVGVHNLCDENRLALFYASAHTGVIYDLASKTQLLLQGHCNGITATAASEDRRRLVSADAGPDSMLVLWDSYSAEPIKSISAPHPLGVAALDLTPDARYAATLSAGPPPQVLSVWDLEAEGESAIFSAQVGTEAAPAETQISVRFRTDDPTELVTNGPSLVIFWSCAGGELAHYAPAPASGALKQRVGPLTATVFLPGTGRAVSITEDGDAVLWGAAPAPELPQQVSAERQAVKLVKLHAAAIRCVAVVGDLLVTGAEDGHVSRGLGVV
jgi:WD40 repeat protein